MKQFQPKDLVIVGCGAGGLSAAVSFLEKQPGAEVVVLERAAREDRGGNTRWTKGFFRLQEDGRPTEDFAERIDRYSLGQADSAIVETLTDEAQRTVAWARSNGVEMDLAQTYFLTSKGSRMMPRGGGAAVVEALAARFEQLGGRIEYQAAALDLIVEDGRIVGVSGLDANEAETSWRAPTVVLATGGFQGNKELLAQHLGERGRSLETICPGGTNNRGEGITMALKAGAGRAGQFDMFHGEPSDPRTNKAEALVMIYPYGILVNREGRRFLDEGKDSVDETFEDVAYHIWRDANQQAYLIVDQLLLQSDYKKAVLSETEPILADSIEELAVSLGIEPSELTATVESYNAACQPGALDVTVKDGVATQNLNPPKSNWARPIGQGPFGAWPMSSVITFTFGGVKTDTAGRAVTPHGEPVPGLYVVGEAAGLYHHSYPGASSMLRAMVFGRLAAADAAAKHIGNSEESYAYNV
jgi:tricarballylate dehydrogenase